MKNPIRHCRGLGQSAPGLRGAFLAVSVAVLAGCQTTQPNVADIQSELPPRYRNAVYAVVASASSETASVEWWKALGSQELNALVAQALATNPELLGAQQQVIQAQAREQQARAGMLPTITAPIRAVEQSQGNRTDSQNSSRLLVAGSYRLDVWGEQSALATSSKLQVQRALHDKENLQRLLVGGLVDTYITLLATKDSLDNARLTAQLLRQGVLVAQQRLALGDSTLDELERQKGAMAAQEVTIAGIENQIDEQLSTLSRYLGVLPGSVRVDASGLAELNAPKVRMGVPSDLLLGRPDIRAMEDRMLAADANIEVARARLMPAIDLASQIGYTGYSYAGLLQPQNLAASTIASLVVAIFDGGGRKAERTFAQSYYDEMVITYRKAILQAVREVESAQTGVRTATRRYEAQAMALQSAQQILKLGGDAYGVGAIDQAGLLEQRKYYQHALDEVKRAKADVLRAHANLAVALGLGGSLTTQQVGNLTAQGHTVASRIDR